MTPRALLVYEYLRLPPRSGGEKRSLRLLEAIERAGATPHILARYADSESLELVRARGWTAEAFPGDGRTARTRRIPQYLRMEPEPANPPLQRRLRALAPESAFVQFEEIEPTQHLRSVPPGTNTVASLHNVDSRIRRDLSRGQLTFPALRTRFRGVRMAAVERRAAQRASVVLCVSEADRRHFAALGANTLLVPNGVDDELFELPPPPPDPRVLFFGAFDWPPNLHGIVRFLREGWPRVAAARPDARLRLVGPGLVSPGPLDPVRAAVDATSGVEIVGFVEDLPAELAANRLIVVPIWIGGGTRIKVLEALAAGRAVVGTPVGVEELGFEHDRHGIVTPTPEGLADGIVELLDDDARLARYAREGHKHVEPYRWSTATRPAEDVYRRWVSAAAS